MTRSLRAIVATAPAAPAVLSTIRAADLPAGDVGIAVACSAVNYKDGLAVTGQGAICRRVPMVCGIDLAGAVVDSRVPTWRIGDRVLVTGCGLSESHWGGYCEEARVDGAWLTRVPEAFSYEQAMACGTAGTMAMLCVFALVTHGVTPGAGPVLVTGASGGTGSLAVMLLARLGYEVHGATGRADTEPYLKALGAAAWFDRGALIERPSALPRWAGAIDAVGSATLATVLARMRPGGLVALCSLRAGATVPAALRASAGPDLALVPIEAAHPEPALRSRVWAELACLVDPAQLARVYRTEPLSAVPEQAARIVAGRVRGRVVIDVPA